MLPIDNPSPAHCKSGRPGFNNEILADAEDHLGTREAAKTPMPAFLTDAKDAGRLAGVLGRAAATNRRAGSVTMFWNLSRAVMEKVEVNASVAMVKPCPLSKLVAAQKPRGFMETSLGKRGKGSIRENAEDGTIPKAMDAADETHLSCIFLPLKL